MQAVCLVSAVHQAAHLGLLKLDQAPLGGTCSVSASRACYTLNLNNEAHSLSTA